MSDGDKMKDFRERVKALEPDRDAVKAQHAKGKLTAEEIGRASCRERV